MIRLILVGLSVGVLISTRGQTTTFTYQGRLSDSAGPATGAFDLRFTLFDALTNGSAVGNPLTNSSVTVSNGLFTVALDFGASVFSGAARWMDIAVRTTGSASAFQPLAPRQQITSSPYAVLALTASNLVNGAAVKSLNSLKDNVTLVAGSNVTITPSGNTLTIASAGAGGSGIWSLNGTNTYYNGGNVGLGTASPVSRLDISGFQDALGITGFQPIFTMRDSSSFNARGVIQSVAGGLNLFSENYMSGANPSAYARLNGNGYFGIGTATPASKLHILSAANDGPPRLQSSGTTGFAAGLDFYQGGLGKGYVGTPDAGAAFGAGELLVYGGVGTKLSLWAGQARAVTIETSGNVGIGTPAPASTLDVRGSIRLGASGQHFATGGEEDLRIVRGEVAGDASAPEGCCFSVNHVSAGVYDITMAIAFSGKPTVTATAKSGAITMAVVDLAPLNSRFRILTYYNSSTADTAFNFIAVGPR